MDGDLKKDIKPWTARVAYTLGGLLIGAIAIMQGWDQAHSGFLHRETYQVEMSNLQDRLDGLVALKNEDNRWYRELNGRVEGIEATVEHTRDDLKRIDGKLDRLFETDRARNNPSGPGPRPQY